MRVKGRPRNWRQHEDLFEAYEEGGKSIGRAIAYDVSKEGYFWKLLGPLKLWPRWYLLTFRTIWRERNMKEAMRIKRRAMAKRKRERQQCQD